MYDATSIECSCDGACKVKGKGLFEGGWGSLIKYKTDNVIFHCSFYGGKAKTTNGEMELTGMLQTLQKIITGPNLKNITIYCDSMYVLKSIVQDPVNQGHVSRFQAPDGWLDKWKTEGWGKIKYKELWEMVDKEIKRIVMSKSMPTITFRWVKGHSGVEMNELSDELANKGITQLHV